jgi:hypothetical protein
MSDYPAHLFFGGGDDRLGETGKLRAENERLRAALQSIAADTLPSATRHHGYRHLADDIHAQAAASLGDTS